jgi:hypothetical protein
MTTEQPRNRGFNLLLTAFSLLTGLAFGIVGYQENDVLARLDDLGLLALGTVLMFWYLIRDNRFQRSMVPVVTILLTVPLQLWAVLNEFNDKSAVRNDIVAIYIYVPVAFFAVYQSVRLSRIPATRPPA